MVLLQRKLYFSKDSTFSRGVQHFPGGGGGASNFFQVRGGVQMLISIETHIACDFPGVVWTPYPPSGSVNGTSLKPATLHSQVWATLMFNVKIIYSKSNKLIVHLRHKKNEHITVQMRLNAYTIEITRHKRYIIIWRRVWEWNNAIQ